MKPKIVFIINHLGYGGHQKMMAFVAEGSRRNFEEVHLIEIYNSDVKLDINKDVTRHLLFNESNNNKDKTNFMKKIRDVIKTSLNLRKKIRDINPDIICAFGIKDIILSIISSFGFNLKIVGSERRSPESYNSKIKLLTKIFYRFCDGLVFQLENAKSFFPQLVRRKSIIIPNPYKSQKEYIPCDVKNRRKVVSVAAARFESQKGIDTLIYAFNEVHKKHGNFRLEIYGEGKLESEYRDIVSSLNLEGSVDFRGVINNVADTVWDSTVFVLPSRLEGIPNVLMEVLGAGVPIVATDCPPGGPRLLTNGGDRGLLVNVDNINEMSDAICMIIEDNALSSRLSRKATEVKKEFDAEKISQSWQHFFKTVLNKN